MVVIVIQRPAYFEMLHIFMDHFTRLLCPFAWRELAEIERLPRRPLVDYPDCADRVQSPQINLDPLRRWPSRALPIIEIPVHRPFRRIHHPGGGNPDRF